MDDKGQVYFGASDKEVSQEDKARYKEAVRELEDRAQGSDSIGGLGHHRKGPWIPEGASIDEAPFEEAQAYDGSREPSKEQE